MRAIILDTETTGHEPPEVIQLAISDYEELDNTRIDEFWYTPSKPPTFGAMAVHKLTPKIIAAGEFPPSSTCRLPSGITHIIGHNVDYDWKALGCPPVKRICTMAIIRKLEPLLDSHTLGAIMFHITPEAEWEDLCNDLREAHNAVSDVLFVACFLQWLVDQRPELRDPEKLWQFSEECRIPDIIAFGKHKGSHIRDLPYGYVQWMRRQPDMDEYVMKAVEKYHR